MAGVNKEIWLGVLIKQFEQRADFLARSIDYSRYVNNDVIHLVDLSMEPEVLVNNTTYPIQTRELTDSDIAIPLYNMETENTYVPDKVLYSASYDKIAAAIGLHRQALQKKSASLAIHAFAPQNHSEATPIIKTRGSDNGNGKTRLTIEDIIRLKRYFDNLKVPNQDRILVLHPDHVNDLLLTDEAFKNQYKDIRSGQVLRLFGFEIYEWADMPIYEEDSYGNVSKVPFGGTTADPLPASVAYYAPRTMYARGTAKMFFEKAENNPEYRRNVIGFSMRFIALPLKQEAIGALVSVSASVQQ